MIYLDHAASTDFYPEVNTLLKDHLDFPVGNPTSIHSRGKDHRFLIDKARIEVAEVFGIEGQNVIFTSGATEALHLGVVGSYLAIPEKERKNKILVSSIAHSCVQGAVNFLGDYFDVERVNIPLQTNGHIDIRKLSEIDLSSFDGVVIEHGNSELGIVQDIQGVGELVRDSEYSPFYMVDVAGSVVSCPGVLNLNTESWKPDSIVLSGEKFGGLSGSGVLIRLSKRNIKPIITGSHEFGMRGGTENIIGMRAFGKALSTHKKNAEALRDYFSELYIYTEHLMGLECPSLKKISGELFLSHMLVYLLPEGMKSDLFVTQLDMEGICISSGSACSSGTVSGNKALMALGYGAEEARRSIRISFGRDTKKEEVDLLVKAMKAIL